MLQIKLMRQLFLIPGTVLWFDPCAHLKEKYNHLNSLICQYYFCILHFVRGYVSCALSDRNSKASKKLPSLLRGLRHLLQILVQGHRVILFLKGNTQKRIYPLLVFFQSHSYPKPSSNLFDKFPPVEIALLPICAANLH